MPEDRRTIIDLSGGTGGRSTERPAERRPQMTAAGRQTTKTPTLAATAARKDRRKEATRRRILMAAEEVFGERGFHDTSIVEITQRARTGQGTFYLYFPSKAAIFEHLVRSRCEELGEALQEARGTLRGTHAVVRATIETFFRWLEEHPSFFRVARQAEFVDPAVIRSWYRAFADRLTASIASQKDQELPGDPETLAWSVMGLVDFNAMRWVVWSEGGPISAERLDAVVAAAIRVLSVEP